MQLIQTGSGLLLLPISTVLGREDTGDGRAATNQLYGFAMEVWLTPMQYITVQSNAHWFLLVM